MYSMVLYTSSNRAFIYHNDNVNKGFYVLSVRTYEETRLIACTYVTREQPGAVHYKANEGTRRQTLLVLYHTCIISEGKLKCELQGSALCHIKEKIISTKLELMKSVRT